MFVRKSRAPRRRAVVRRPKAPAKSLTKVQKVEVKRLIAAPAETKYVAATAYLINGGAPVLGVVVPRSIVSGGATTTAIALIPQLTQGVDGHQRIGNKISGLTLKSDFQFWINPAITNYPTMDATVKLFIVRAKSMKSQSLLAQLPVGGLLDAGDGTSIDWTSTTAVADKFLATYPLNKELFTVCKIKTFRLTKNQDSATAGVNPTGGSSPNLSFNQQHDYSYTHKHKSTVVYPDNNLVGFAVPENFTYFAFMVVYDTNAYTSLPDGSILTSVRSHMWYKDM